MPNREHKASSGAAAEQRALAHLRGQGLRLLARNYRSRWGEIDLVMHDERELVFIEVRYRRHCGFGGALGSIDARKRERIARTARDFLARRARPDQPARFDVVTVSAAGEVDWIAGAFDAG